MIPSSYSICFSSARKTSALFSSRLSAIFKLWWNQVRRVCFRYIKHWGCCLFFWQWKAVYACDSFLYADIGATIILLHITALATDRRTTTKKTGGKSPTIRLGDGAAQEFLCSSIPWTENAADDIKRTDWKYDFGIWGLSESYEIFAGSVKWGREYRTSGERNHRYFQDGTLLFTAHLCVMSRDAIRLEILLIFPIGATIILLHITALATDRRTSNIIGNAVRYSPSGECVSISLRASKDRYALEVENTGVSIPEEDMEHMFVPFYRTDKSRSKAAEAFWLRLLPTQKAKPLAVYFLIPYFPSWKYLWFLSPDVLYSLPHLTLLVPFYRTDKSRSRSTGGSGLGLYIVKTILDLHHMGYGIKNTQNGVMFFINMGRQEIRNVDTIVISKKTLRVFPFFRKV